MWLEFSLVKQTKMKGFLALLLMLVLQQTKLAHTTIECDLVESQYIKVQVSWCAGAAHAQLATPFHYCNNVNCKSTRQLHALEATSTTGKQLHHG